MNWDAFKEVSEDLVKFMYRVIQWLQYLFGDGKWNPSDIEDIYDLFG